MNIINCLKLTTTFLVVTTNASSPEKSKDHRFQCLLDNFCAFQDGRKEKTYKQITPCQTFTTPREKDFDNVVGKRENAGDQHCIFSQYDPYVMIYASMF